MVKIKKTTALVAIIIILIITTIILFNYLSKKQIPVTSGEITLQVTNDVTVTTDKKGVPHIKAENEHDLFYAQGYIQASERLFQMDLSRRQASGTLSEIIGSAAIDNDKYFRTLGLRRAAEKSADIYPKETTAVLDAFADGVNAFIDEASKNKTLPLEYALLGAKPEPWIPLDSLTIGKYMAFDLGGHWESQAFNYYLLQTFDNEKALELFPSYPKNKPTIIDSSEVNIGASFDKSFIPHAFNGSNNWVVSGDKTASGKPLLADDPHLGLSTPSVWYEMVLETDTLNVSGVIFAGVPGIILGHNAEIAWGVTNTGPDVQQLFLEKRHPEKKYEFLYDDEWEPAQVILEPIKVKDHKTIDYEVIETRHGPIVSDFSKETNNKEVFSLQWTALEATTELLAILEINKASNWDEFEKGLEYFLAPAQNFVFMDTSGTIAYKVNGNIPIYENGTDALLPLSGWDKKYQLKEYIPFDKLPKVINPEKGYIATANNKVTPDNYPYHISNVWAQPFRYERIQEVLESSDSLTAQDMKDLQMDTINLRAKEFIPLLSKEIIKDNLTKNELQALDTLIKWNYDDNVTRSEPLIFDAWIKEIETQLYKEIPEDVMTLFSSRSQTTDDILRRGNNSIWVTQQADFESFLTDSFSKTINKLEKTYGTNQKVWRWGKFHHVAFEHPLSQANKLTETIFNRHLPREVGGSGVTVMAASHTDEGLVDHGASWRFVIDGSDFTSGEHTVGPGQSGHFRSKWYSNQFDDWVDGKYHTTTLTEPSGDILLIKPTK